MRTVCGRQPALYLAANFCGTIWKHWVTTVSEVISLLSRMAQSTSVDAVWQIAANHFASCGFSRVNYGYTRFRVDWHLGDPDDAIFLTTTSPDYVKVYFNEGFYARTPMYRWVMENTGACTWEWVEKAFHDGLLPEDEANAVARNMRMGIHAGVSISFPETSLRDKGALGLIADPRLGHAEVAQIWATRGEEIMAVAGMMHLKVTQLPMATRRRPLTARQREALEWVADGKTMQDIALLMDISAAMVEKHLRLAREALNVDTTAQAVAKGALLNMIFPPASAAAS